MHQIGALLLWLCELGWIAPILEIWSGVIHIGSQLERAEVYDYIRAMLTPCADIFVSYQAKTWKLTNEFFKGFMNGWWEILKGY